MAWWRRADEALDGQDPVEGGEVPSSADDRQAAEPTEMRAAGDHQLPWATLPPAAADTSAGPGDAATQLIPTTGPVGTLPDPRPMTGGSAPSIGVEPARHAQTAIPVSDTPLPGVEDADTSAATAAHTKENDVADFQTSLNEAMNIEGALGVALVDSTSGMALATAGNPTSLDLTVAAAGNSSVVQAKLRTLRDLGLSEQIEDILITLDTQYHILRTFGAEENMFLYLALDKSRANLAMARYRLAKIESQLQL